VQFLKKTETTKEDFMLCAFLALADDDLTAFMFILLEEINW